MNKLNKLIKELEVTMEEGWVAYANGEPTSDDVYFVMEELAELGIGKVLIPNMQGKMSWFSLEDQSF